jgi:hypothetical protein
LHGIKSANLSAPPPTGMYNKGPEEAIHEFI